MTGDPAVIQALNDVFTLEVTTFEVIHAFEHVFQHRKYKCLRRWYDKQVCHSRGRRRYLTDRCFDLDGMLTVQLKTTTVDPKSPPEAILTATLALALDLLAAYHSGYEIAEDKGDNVTADGLCDLQKEVEDFILTLEAFAGEIADLGLQAFLASKLK
jgi:bacterioferritin (cytochrome b1)